MTNLKLTPRNFDTLTFAAPIQTEQPRKLCYYDHLQPG